MVTLPDYIAEIGDEQAAKKFKVDRRIAMSWRLLERRPRPATAKMITAKSPVTWEGIYSPDIKPRRIGEGN